MYKLLANDANRGSVHMFLNSIKSKLKQLLDVKWKKHPSLKGTFELVALFFMFKNDTQKPKSLGTKNIPIYFNYDFDRFEVEEYQGRDSRWAFFTYFVFRS